MSENTANLEDPGQQPVGWDGRTPVPPPTPPTVYQPYEQARQTGYGTAGQTAYAPIGPPYGATTTTATMPAPPAPPRSGGFRRGAVATVAAVAIALGAGGVGGYVGYTLHPNSPSALQNTTTPSGNAAPVVDRSSLASIAASIQPTVVVIQTGSGEGSGVVLTQDGYIVTNNHVVSGARGTVNVTFNSGKTVSASIVGTDPKTDLAVVKASVTGLTFAQWGNSDDVRVGDTVLAIGSPLGLQGSVTAGIVSALHRTITVGDQESQFQSSSRTTIGDAIQTDAPINPGNSGGALVDTNGKIVGINSAIATSGSNGNIGVGFAIPSNRAKTVAEAIIKGGKVSHPYLGVSIAASQNGGAAIQSVESGGPAEKAGVKVGDVIVKFGNRTIASGEDLIGAIQSSAVGTQSTITVERGGSEQTLTVTVGEQP